MKILKVIHGYPMLYNAGSEVYSQTICHGLTKHGHEVYVFTREEDPFRPDGDLRIDKDSDIPEIKLFLVNNPRFKDRYRSEIIDRRFGEVLDEIRPDIVHIGHLNHLSTSLVFEAKRRTIPIVYTLHDYWLMCPRGQFMQMHSEDFNLWADCDGQEDKKCAKMCYARYFSGDPSENEIDMDYWTEWVNRRMNHISEIVDCVDIFISPSKYLKARYEMEFGLPISKSIFLDYGFDRKRLEGRNRQNEENFVFGYIGTHIPAKGIAYLIQAFSKISDDTELRIWGRERGEFTNFLKRMVNQLSTDKISKIIWMGEYKNQKITEEVFNKTDCIVVPSIWVENSPLVIHEAQQAGVPVITADAGGMSEYVRHEKNGLLFKFRSIEDLAHQMDKMASDRQQAEKMGKCGYLYEDDGQIPDIDKHINDLENIYKSILGIRNE